MCVLDLFSISIMIILRGIKKSIPRQRISVYADRRLLLFTGWPVNCNHTMEEEVKMGKRIVVLNGSPRKNGNTSALVKSFTEGAQKAGHTVTEFFLDQMEIHGCKGCFGGDSSRECPCAQKDDMDQIYPEVKSCDVVVFATPLYYWNMSGQIRTAVDRLFALEEGKEGILRGQGRGGVLLMAAEGEGFEDVVLYFDHLMEHLRWDNLGHVLAGGNMNVGDISGKPELQMAFDLGASI